MKKIAFAAFASAAALACLASPVQAMKKSPPVAGYTPSRALTDLQAVSDETVKAYEAEPLPAAKASYDLTQYAIKAAAYADQTGDKKTFDRQAADVRKSHTQACAVLSGC